MEKQETEQEQAEGAAPAEAGPERRRGRLRLLRRALLVAGPLIAVVVGGYFYLTGGRYVGTENAYVKADTVMVAAEVAGLISEVSVRENQHVEKGQVLFRIDDRPYSIALDEAEARLARVVDEIAGLKAEYRQRAAELAMGRSDLEFAEKELERQSSLLATNTTSRSRFDAASHDAEAVRRRMRVTEQAMAQVAAQLAGDPDIPAEHHPSYREMKAARDRAALDLERTVVRAPFAGVAGNTPEPGQQVTGNGALSSPVMSIVADNGAWVEANFKETDLTYAQPGQPVTIRVDAYPDREWTGTVQSISQATGAEFAVLPPQNATGNWVKVVQRVPVRIVLERSEDEPVLRAGMSAGVEVDTGRRRELPQFAAAIAGWLDPSPPIRAAQPR